MESHTDDILQILEQVDTPGTFAVLGTERNMVQPGVDIEGIGLVPLPLLAHTGSSKLETSLHAWACDHGDRTEFDPSMKQPLYIPAGRWNMSHPRWNETLNHIVEIICTELGLDEVTASHVCAHENGLHLYRSGDHFAAHRDTEKETGHFATLIYVLPSEHEGGDLSISHAGDTMNLVNGGSDSLWQCSWAAFYSDCLHEMKPVTSGYLLAATYKLVCEDGDEEICAPHTAPLDDALTTALASWAGDAESTAIAWLADDIYSTLSLREAVDLNGNDRAVGAALVRAAEKLDMKDGPHVDVFVATESMQRDVPHMQVEDYLDAYKELEYVRVLYGDRLTMAVRESLVVKTIPYKLLNGQNFVDHDHSDYSHYAYSYREGYGTYEHTLLLVCPRTESILTDFLHVDDGKWRELVSEAACPDDIVRLGHILLDKRYHCHWTVSVQDIEHTQSLGDVGQPLVRAMLERVCDSMPELNDFGPLVAAADAVGWTHAMPIIEQYLECVPEQIWDKYAPMLSKLVSILPCDNDVAVTLAVAFGERVFSCAKTEFRLIIGHCQQDRSSGLICLLRSAMRLDLMTGSADLWLRRALDIIQPHRITNVNTLIGLARGMLGFPSRQPLTSFYDSVVHVATNVSKKLEKEANRSFALPSLACKCSLCAPVNTFLRSQQRVGRFPLAKRNRYHVHQEIDSTHVEVSHTTERTGSPFTLVVTKTTAERVSRLVSQVEHLKDEGKSWRSGEPAMKRVRK